MTRETREKLRGLAHRAHEHQVQLACLSSYEYDHLDEGGPLTGYELSSDLHDALNDTLGTIRDVLPALCSALDAADAKVGEAYRRGVEDAARVADGRARSLEGIKGATTRVSVRAAELRATATAIRALPVETTDVR